MQLVTRIQRYINNYGIYTLLFWFFICISILVTIKHNNFYSYGFDLGIFDQVVWQYSQWNFPASSSIRNIENILWDHFHPVLILYAFVYKIYSSALTLLYLQNFAFVLGWLWIYKIAKYFKLSSIFWLAVVLIYLLFEWNIRALLFDFHPMVVAISLLPWLVYLWLRNKTKLSYLIYGSLFLFIIFSKENMSLYLIFLGIFQLFFQPSRRLWVLGILLWTLYFYAVMNYFIPAMWWNNGSYWSYDAVWSSPWDMIQNIFSQPLIFIDVLLSHSEKLITYAKHLTSGGIFMIFTPAILLIIPWYAQKFLSSREEFWTMEQFHYSIDISWALLIGVILFFVYLQRISRRRQIYSSLTKILQMIFIVLALCVNLYNSPLRWISYHWENNKTIYSFISDIPSSASISTQNSLIPHLSQRKDIYLFPMVAGADYILLEKYSKDGWPLRSREEFESIFNAILENKQVSALELPFVKESFSIESRYKLLKEQNNVYLFEKIK